MKHNTILFILLFLCSCSIAYVYGYVSYKANDELPFVILICSYNAKQWVEKNLSSIARQEYTNYRIVYVEDGSDDGTADQVIACATALGIEHKLTLISNKTRRRKLANMYDAIHACADNEIIILLDGDDWLEENPYIFKKINEVYHRKNCWFTYSQYRNEPKSEATKWGFRELGYSAPIPLKIKQLAAYRNYVFVFMHLRTFYAWLFKQIKLADLIAHKVEGYQGKFYPAANDLAIVFPMVEMADKYIHFIQEILCVRNVYSNIVGFKVDNPLQLASSMEIRKKTTYDALKNIEPAPASIASGPIDACIFFTGDCKEVLDKIKKLRTHTKKLRRIVVLYDINQETIQQIRYLKQVATIEACAYGTTIHLTCAQALEDYIHTSKVRYLLMCIGNTTFKTTINLNTCIHHLEKTGAYGFYFQQQKPPVYVECTDLYAWKFKSVSKKWRNPYALGWSLYRAQDVIDHMKQVPASYDIHSLICHWCYQEKDHPSIGIMFSS